MTDTAALGALIFMLLCLVIVAICALLVHLARDWAADRRREEAYAREWQDAHFKAQDLGRYGHDVEGRPE